MKYKKNFFIAGIFITVLYNNVYCGEYRRVLAEGPLSIKCKKIYEDLQKLETEIVPFEDSIKKNTNFSELDNDQLNKLLTEVKTFATRIMNARQAVEENGNNMQKILSCLKGEYIEPRAIIRKLENMYARNNDLLDLLDMAKRVKNLKF